MTDPFKKKWVIVGLIWSGVFLLTGLNTIEISRIVQLKRTAEVLQKDREFRKRHHRDIEAVLKRAASAYQRTASARLGLLSVETRLRSLAGQFGLTKFKMESRPDQNGKSGMVVNIFFSGPLSGAMQWVAALEKDYLYLKPRKLKMTLRHPDGPSDFVFSCYYRFRPSVPEDTG